MWVITNHVKVSGGRQAVGRHANAFAERRPAKGVEADEGRLVYKRIFFHLVYKRMAAPPCCLQLSQHY
jgi:hypothetical protein